jgi:hypothetical protein
MDGSASRRLVPLVQFPSGVPRGPQATVIRSSPEASIHVLEYQAASAKRRPRLGRAAIAVVLPWLLQCVVLGAVYLPTPVGVAGHGYFLLLSLLAGVCFGCAMIVRSGFSSGLKALWLCLYVPAQIICLEYISVFVGLAFGARDTM